jgi:hypothetical protein
MGAVEQYTRSPVCGNSPLQSSTVRQLPTFSYPGQARSVLIPPVLVAVPVAALVFVAVPVTLLVLVTVVVDPPAVAELLLAPPLVAVLVVVAPPPAELEDELVFVPPAPMAEFDASVLLALPPQLNTAALLASRAALAAWRRERDAPLGNMGATLADRPAADAPQNGHAGSPCRKCRQQP